MIGIKTIKRLFQRQGKGPYRLSRLFFNFYIVSMGTFIAIALIADFVISRAQHDKIEESARRFMQGTVRMVEMDLDRYPNVLWYFRIEDIQAHFAYPIHLLEREQLNALLTLSDLNQIDSGEMVISLPDQKIYQRLGNTSFVLSMGPFAQSLHEGTWLSLEMRLRLLTWSFIALLFALALYFWIRPIWRDLEHLRQTAALFGPQHQKVYAHAHSKLFAPLSIAFNSMIRRIDELLKTHKELTSGIAHELRTPLARMRFALAMLCDLSDSPKEEQARFIHNMERDLDELDKLIDTNLTYARMEREEFHANFESINLYSWFTNELDNLRFLAQNIEFETHNQLLENTFGEIDLKLMPYAVRNLIRNAFKYAQNKVKAQVLLENETLIFIVEDDGIGIDDADKKRIFSAFTRLDRSRDRQTGGYGLGLAITKRAVYLHAGEVYAEDSALGGARFVLRFPQYQKNPRST